MTSEINSVKKRKWGDEKDTSRVSSSSPSSSTTSGPAPPSSAAEAAAKAAAMVTALLAAKGISIDNKPMDFSKIEPPPPPVLRPAPLSAPPHVQKRAFNPEDPEEGIVKKGEKFLKKVDINDHRNRYLLVRADTQKQLSSDSGAEVIHRGKFYPDRSLATDRDPPLHIQVSSKSKEAVQKALRKMDELMNQELKWKEAKVPVKVEVNTIGSFPLRSKIVGQQGAFVKHIQGITGARIQIRGQGSGYKEVGTDEESHEPLYVHITAQRDDAVRQATQLVEDLLSTVRVDLDRWRLRNGSHNGFIGASMPIYSDPTPPPPPPPAPEDGDAPAPYQESAAATTNEPPNGSFNTPQYNQPSQNDGYSAAPSSSPAVPPHQAYSYYNYGNYAPYGGGYAAPSPYQGSYATATTPLQPMSTYPPSAAPLHYPQPNSFPPPPPSPFASLHASVAGPSAPSEAQGDSTQ